jgi:hypothetical protein
MEMILQIIVISVASKEQTHFVKIIFKKVMQRGEYAMTSVNYFMNIMLLFSIINMIITIIIRILTTVKQTER